MFSISVIIPFHNRENEILLAINSVLNQTRPVNEIILVNDGSTDGTLNKISSIQNPKIKLLSNQKRMGASYSRNKGIKETTSDWIAFLDSDDEWEKSRIENLHEFLKINKEINCLYSGAKINYGNKTYFRNSRDLEKSESIFDFLISHETFSPTPSLVIKSWIAKKILFDESLNRHEDFDFIIRSSQISKWKFFDCKDITVNWKYRTYKNVDLSSCIDFYKKNSYLSLNREVRIKYIKWISEVSAKQNPQKSLIDFFRRELENEKVKFTLREYLLFNFPLIFHKIYKIKKMGF